MTLDKLKVAARQQEQREDWRGAIELYRQAVREADGASEASDPSVHNRIGDLELKAANPTAACEAWEQAALRYAELGFFNNAIALCSKILRVDPARVRTHLELARLHARKRVLFDTRQQLTTYLERMASIGQRDASRAALEAFGEEFRSWHELQHLIDELLGRDRRDPAEQGRGHEAEHGRGLVFLDTGALQIERASEPDDTGVAAAAETAVVDVEIERPSEVADVGDFEPTSLGIGSDAVVRSPVAGLVGTHLGVDESTHHSALEGFEATSLPAPEPASPSVADSLVYIDTADAHGAGTSQETVADIPIADADDPIGQRLMGQALIERGDRAGGIAALERGLELHTERDEGVHAFQAATELVHADPLNIARHQARVEVAARSRDTPRLCEAYADLGDALVRTGNGEKAIAVYRRVLELNDRDERARAALRAMLPADDAPAVADGFVDFGAMVIDDAGPRSTRMRTETTAISDDEDETFREALAEFKRALDQNVDVDDYQAHYDLGIAFKEMGLLDEAIGAFQKALRSSEGRLRTSEALGSSFFEQGRPAVAEAVLRAVERGPEGDAEKIGVLYWLGRAVEAQGKSGDARAFYERVLAVDIGFSDTADRITQLQTGGAG